MSKRFVRPTDTAARIVRLFRRADASDVTYAVDDVHLNIGDGEVVGLVGESGCGKTTVGRIAAGLLPPSEGRVTFEGRDMAGLRGADARSTRLAVQMVFQDPYASLNPRMHVGDLVGQAPRLHGLVPEQHVEAYVRGLLDRIGLDASYATRYPHQMSGGQRQRVCVARALAVNPKVLVCDEAVAALDVSIQAQMLNLFLDLREDLGLSYLFISHDLSVVEHISDRVVIMYFGRVVETAETQELFRHPNHPYTQALLADVPRVDARHRKYSPLRGEIPSPLHPPTGCHFHPRCPNAMARCREERPALRAVAPGRLSACHLNDLH